MQPGLDPKALSASRRGVQRTADELHDQFDDTDSLLAGVPGGITPRTWPRVSWGCRQHKAHAASARKRCALLPLTLAVIVAPGARFGPPYPGFFAPKFATVNLASLCTPVNFGVFTCLSADKPPC